MINGYNDLTSLKITNGLSNLALSRLKEPNNVLVHYFENYADFFILFIQEDSRDYKQRIKNRDFRLGKIKMADSNSPYYLFAQAEIILQWAVIKLKFDDKIGAATDVLDAYKLLKENKKKYPDFTPNNKSLSIIHATAESLPSWVRKIVGVKGSIADGTQEIKNLVENTGPKDLFFTECVAIYSYILFYANNQKEDAYQVLIKYKLNHRNNPLVAFLVATMAQKTGRNEMAIKILQERPQDNSYLRFYYLDFIYGKALLYKLDKSAKTYIQIFINNFNGRHYIKEAYQKLAWYHLSVNRDIEAYHKTLAQSVAKGHTSLDEDIQAAKEAKSNEAPDITLLQARLIFDGGYYAKAKILLNKNQNAFKTKPNKDEFHYRLGRVEEALGNTNAAITSYKNTITTSNPKKYFACNAALLLGLIYEEKHDYISAKSYFNKCISLNPDEYVLSLHTKAKAGIHRLKSK